MIDIHVPAAALTLWQEARGEPIEGQKAVAHVLANRLHDGRWGITLGEVCFSEFKGVYQFSGWGRNDPNRKTAFRLSPNDTLLGKLAGLIQSALTGEADPTNGATHYYSKSIPAPAWAKDATFCGQFGNQLFYKGVL